MNTFSTFRSVAAELRHIRSSQVFPSSWLTSPQCTRSLRTTFLPPPPCRRSFHTSHTRGAWVKNNQPSRPAKPRRDRRRERLLAEIGLRNSDIPYNMVKVLERGGFSPYRRLTEVLAEADRLNAAESDEDDTGEDGLKKSFRRYQVRLTENDPDPVVKIFDTREEYMKAKASREQARVNATHRVRKEVQLTWASSEMDVGIKLEKVREELEKGYKVDLAVMSKRGKRAPSFNDMQGRAQTLLAQLTGVAKEWREPDFTRKTVVLYLQGTTMPAAETKAETEDKVLLKAQRRERMAEKTTERRQRDDGFLIKIQGLPP